MTRLTVPLSLLLLAGCAPRTPLDLIPQADLLMMEAAERMAEQAPLAVRNAPGPDLEAQYAAALAAAGLVPVEPEAPRQTAPLPPQRRPDAAAVAPSSPAVIAPPAGAGRERPKPLPDAQAAARPISVEEMLARVRSKAEPKP